MSAHTPRTFEVPAALVAAGYGPTADLDVLDREVEFPGKYGEWAEKVLFSENAKTLTNVCGDMRLLPRGILSSMQLDDDSLLISGLVDSDGRVWDSQFNAWGKPSADVDVIEDSVILDDDEVAFVARALQEGADEVWFRPYIPKAFVSAVVADSAEEPVAQQVPNGSAIVAVVDPIDNDAVLEMLAITPGPHVLRRHDGAFYEDPAWVPVLKSIHPPKIVKLTEPQVASVASQVDRSTKDQDWEPFDIDSREQYQIFTASSYIQELQRETDEKALFALVAVAGREVTPKDVLATERLKKYWTVGRGAAKIRWGTPGSWRRCYRHLVKYVGPKVAPGYCTNLSMRLGGPGIATHVGDVKPIPGKGLPGSVQDDWEDRAWDAYQDVGEIGLVAANPTGENGYDHGQTFREGNRDYHGRFAPGQGGGGTGGSRLERRKSSIARSRKAREEKESKKSDSAANKAKREREKAKREAQQQELARLSLAISQASAAGNTIQAAELRVQRAERRLAFADTSTERLNAQTALVNAKTALARARVAKARKAAAARKADTYASNWKDPGRSSTDRSLDMPDEKS